MVTYKIAQPGYMLGAVFYSVLIMTALKLIGRIHWDWLWIVSPLWGMYALVIFLLFPYLWLLKKDYQHSRRF